jgi:hypothetical protein
MTIRDKVDAFVSIVGPFARDEINFPLTDAEAITLAHEIGAKNCRNAELVADALEALDAVGDRPAPEAGDDALITWAGKAQAARALFWSAFEGEPVRGVNIIRRR